MTILSSFTKVFVVDSELIEFLICMLVVAISLILLSSVGNSFCSILISFALSIQGGGKLIWILFVLVLFFRTFSKACLILALLKQRSKRLCGVSRMISLLVWMVSIASSTKPPGIFLGRMLHKLSPNSFLMAKFEILEYYSYHIDPKNSMPYSSR